MSLVPLYPSFWQLPAIVPIGCSPCIMDVCPHLMGNGGVATAACFGCRFICGIIKVGAVDNAFDNMDIDVSSEDVNSLWVCSK